MHERFSTRAARCLALTLGLGACGGEANQLLAEHDAGETAGDAELADTVRPDTDTETPDAHAPDIHAPDTDVADTARPDTAEVPDAGCVPYTPGAPEAGEFMWQGGHRLFHDEGGR